MLFAGVSAVPVFFTGEGAEEAIEHLPGVSENVIEKHEALAKVAFGLVVAAAIVSLIGLLFYRQAAIRRAIRPLVLILAFATSVIMVVTAHFGGQVRHTEIRSGFEVQTENGTNNTGQSKLNEDKD